MKFLNLQGSPISDELADGIKKELILALEDVDFEKINKEDVTDEDHKEAEELRQERIKEEEERLKAEAEGENKGDE